MINTANKKGDNMTFLEDNKGHRITGNINCSDHLSKIILTMHTWTEKSNIICTVTYHKRNMPAGLISILEDIICRHIDLHATLQYKTDNCTFPLNQDQLDRIQDLY